MMNITVKKNRILTIGNYKLKCSIGKSGIKKNKKEGDLATPKGVFRLGFLYYRKDRNKPLKCKIKKVKHTAGIYFIFAGLTSATIFI